MVNIRCKLTRITNVVVPIWHYGNANDSTFATMKLTYNNIFNRCQDISSYEGGRIVDDKGDSMYSVVHMTEQDKPLIEEYVKQSVESIRTQLYYAIDSISEDAEGVSISFISDQRLNADTAEARKSTESVITSYVMWQWLADKSDERAKAWSEIYNEMLRVMPMHTRKKKPVLDED